MTLALTGLTVFFAESTWAPAVMSFLGGPQTAGLIHRAGAIGFMSVFFIHLIYFAIRIGRNWRETAALGNSAFLFRVVLCLLALVLVFGGVLK